jgi:hypothetical protein
VSPPRQAPVERAAALAEGLGLVAGAGPALGAGGGGRGDVEQGLLRHDLGDPGLVGRVVAGDAPLAAGAEGAGDQRQQRRVDEAALGVAGLGPGIGEEQEEAVERALRQQAEQVAGILRPEAEMAGERGGGLRALGDQGGEQRAEAILEDLGGDVADPGIGPDLGQAVLAAAEADLQPERLDGRGEGGARIGRLARGGAASRPAGAAGAAGADGRAGGRRAGRVGRRKF